MKFWYIVENINVGRWKTDDIKGPVQTAGNKMDIVHTPVPATINVHKQLGKGNNYPEISGKFGFVASKTYEKGRKYKRH